MTRYVPRDHYFRRAKREGYAARSVYKLEELDRKLHLLRAGARVLDLGAAPGSWSQYACDRVGPTGVVVAVDQKPLSVRPPPSLRFIQADVFDLEPQALTAQAGGPFDVVLSDMAPATSGDHFVDQQRSADLCLRALALARVVLRAGGHLVVKILTGESAQDVVGAMKNEFDSVQQLRPQSTRKGSTEMFIIGRMRRVYRNEESR